MEIYLVRHGESESNALNLHQTPDVKLSKKGLDQAGFLAERFQNIPIDIIVSSPFERAKKTAEIISEKINKPLTFNPLFTEIRRPSEFWGKKLDDPEVVKVKEILAKNYHQSGWRYSDEENFEDLKERSLKALDFLKNSQEENILVVTHGVFMKILLAAMIFGEKITSQQSLDFQSAIYINNTGLTKVKLEEDSFKIMTLNDHAHLG